MAKTSNLYQHWIKFIDALLDKSSVDLLWSNEVARFTKEKKALRLHNGYVSKLLTIFEYLNTYKLHIYSEILDTSEIEMLNTVSWQDLSKWLS